jgi:Ca-activated chloride channel family protein
MSFLWIEMLWLLLLVPVIVGFYLIILRRRKKYAVRYASLSLVREALGRGPGFRRHVPPLLLLCGLAVMLFALGRPAAAITLPSQEGTVILTLDVSGSMRADDVQPNRIEAAKTAAKAFVEKQPPNVRIGVVSFSESASLVQAPTKDRTAVTSAINRLTTQRRTAIGSGILTSLGAIFDELGAKSPTPDFGHDVDLPPSPATVEPGTYAAAAIVLLSDGQSNTGPLPVDAADRAAGRGVRVYTVGLGNPEGAVLQTGGYSVRVRLDEETLKTVAQKTDGKYFKAENETDLLNIYSSLGSKLTFKPELTELTAAFTAIGVLFVLTAASLSLWWFNRLA